MRRGARPLGHHYVGHLVSHHIAGSIMVHHFAGHQAVSHDFGRQAVSRNFGHQGVSHNFDFRLHHNYKAVVSTQKYCFSTQLFFCLRIGYCFILGKIGLIHSIFKDIGRSRILISHIEYMIICKVT